MLPGTPQAPPPQQSPIGIAGAFDVRGPEAVNTEKRWSSCLPWQAGHSGSADPMISVSKLWLQSLQMYSKIGMIRIPE